MASIRKDPRTVKSRKGDVRWQVQYRDDTNKPRTKGGFPSKADAKAWAEKIETDKRQGVFRDPAHDRVTYGAWHDRWWRLAKVSDRAPATIAQYEALSNRHILPHLAGRKLVDLEVEDFEEWLGKLRQGGLSASTIRTCRVVASMVLSHAADHRIIPANPIAGRKMGRKPTASKAKQALTVQQVEALAEAADAPNLRYRELVLVMAYGGLRPNEAFALRPRDLDDFGNLVVSAGIVEVRGKLYETDGKTHTSRVVPLPSSVESALRGRIEREHIGADCLIFTTPKAGTAIRLRKFREQLGGAAKQADLPDWFTPYTLRHTCASLMASQGVPVHEAARIMGHDPAIFLRTYAHLYPGDLRRAANSLEALRAGLGDGCRTDVVRAVGG